MFKNFFMYLFAAVLGLSIATAIGFPAHFITGEIPAGGTLYLEYFLYAASVIILFHFVFLVLNKFLKDRNSPHRKRIPKYLEYVYALLISFGFAQVFLASSHGADYIKFVAGDEDAIVTRIREQAAKDVTQCNQSTDDYCKEIAAIVNQNSLTELKSYIVNVVAFDNKFLDFMELETAAGASGFVTPPIVGYVKQFLALHEYGANIENHIASSVFWWLALLLLPVGIALRLVKTSLELFGDLEAQQSFPAATST